MICHNRNAIIHKWTDGSPEKGVIYGSKTDVHLDDMHPFLKTSRTIKEEFSIPVYKEEKKDGKTVRNIIANDFMVDIELWYLPYGKKTIRAMPKNGSLYPNHCILRLVANRDTRLGGPSVC